MQREAVFSTGEEGTPTAVGSQGGTSQNGEGEAGEHSERSFREKQHLKWNFGERERFGQVDTGEGRLGGKFQPKGPLGQRHR